MRDRIYDFLKLNIKEDNLPPKILPLVDWLGFQPSPVVGVDEAGRGCLAGPVVAAAVILKKSEPGLFFDSKTLTEARREELCTHIKEQHFWSVGICSVEEIEKINILRASLLAMRKAVMGLKVTAGHVLVDGPYPVPNLKDWKQTPLIQGDSRAEPVSAASIVAKVTRDHLMKKLAEEFPHYGFAEHKGYGTIEHRRALEKMGPCAHHRRGFKGVEF